MKLAQSNVTNLKSFLFPNQFREFVCDGLLMDTKQIRVVLDKLFVLITQAYNMNNKLALEVNKKIHLQVMLLN